jgi:hypothetical protein
MFASNRTGHTAPSVIAAAIMAGAIIASTASFAVPRYDGLWSVSIVTEKGDCDRGYRYPVRISNGTLANGGDTMFTINIGTGSWSGGSCSGSWSAERRSS